MKKTALVLMVLILLAPLAAHAADGQATYNAKCKMCHGPDGKKIAKANFDKPEAELVNFVMTDAKHKSKVADKAAAQAVVAFLKKLAN